MTRYTEANNAVVAATRLSPQFLDQISFELIRDEDLKTKVYKCPAGKPTIGVGRNLDPDNDGRFGSGEPGLTPQELLILGATLQEVVDGKEITREQALYLLDDDIIRCVGELDRKAAWWRNMPSQAMRGLLNMNFNMGWPKLSEFKRMLAALEEGRFSDASVEALDSDWAAQTGARARRIHDLFRFVVLKQMAR